MTENQKKRLQSAANFAVALVKKGVEDTYAVAIVKAAKAHMRRASDFESAEDYEATLTAFKHAISKELSFRCKEKITRSQQAA